MSSKIDSNQTFISTPAKIKYWHILAILSLALFSYCSNQPEYPSVDAILCQPKPEPPILTSVSAICFAMHFEGIADSMRKAQKQASYTGWNASAARPIRASATA